jgi:hypothetical protein
LRCHQLSFAVFLSATFTQKKPNILVIMTEDVAVWNICGYHRGISAAYQAELHRRTRDKGIRTSKLAPRNFMFLISLMTAIPAPK